MLTISLSILLTWAIKSVATFFLAALPRPLCVSVRSASAGFAVGLELITKKRACKPFHGHLSMVHCFPF